jgi:hypothetical protein
VNGVIALREIFGKLSLSRFHGRTNEHTAALGIIQKGKKVLANKGGQMRALGLKDRNRPRVLVIFLLRDDAGAAADALVGGKSGHGVVE